MFEFLKLCNEYEKLSVVERGLLIAGKSAKVISKLKTLDLDGVDPIKTLAAYIVGSVTADGVIDEQEYLLIYPALVKLFGENFDFASVKEAFRKNVEGKKAVKKYTQQLMTILSCVDEEIKEDVVCLCLCVVTVDRKISLKERRYIKSLIKA